MKNLLYIGNKLSNKNKTATTIDTLGKHLEEEGFNLRYTSTKKNKLIRLCDMVIITYKNRRWADAVLIDTYSTTNFYYAWIVAQLCKWFNIDYYPILHGGNLPERLICSPKLSRSIFKFSKSNIAPSSYIHEAFTKGGYFNCVLVPNSINIDEYKVIERSNSGINLLWVRSFSNLYNPKLAIDVLVLLKEFGYESSLCMIGPDNDGSLEETKAYAVLKNVEVDFTGKLTKKEWVQRAKSCNYFINTTNFDNMPVSVIEAMALGLPIVSTNVGGLPYLINDKKDGVLVPPNDSIEMTNKLINLHNSPQKQTAIITAARIKAESFSWEKVSLKWLDLLKKS